MPKKPLFGENAKLWTCRLYSWEKESVKKFIKSIRDEKREKIKKIKKENNKNEFRK